MKIGSGTRSSTIGSAVRASRSTSARGYRRRESGACAGRHICLRNSHRAPLGLAPGFRGTLIFGSEDEANSIVLYRFEHEADFDAFRESALALAFLGPVGALGESHFAARPMKTFGASA